MWCLFKSKIFGSEKTTQSGMELSNAKVKHLTKKTLFNYSFRGKFQNTWFSFNPSAKFLTYTVFPSLRYGPTVMNATKVCVNISIIYFLLVINTTIDIITAQKQQLQSIHFNEEHFSSPESSIDVVVITIS